MELLGDVTNFKAVPLRKTRNADLLRFSSMVFMCFQFSHIELLCFHQLETIVKLPSSYFQIYSISQSKHISPVNRKNQYFTVICLETNFSPAKKIVSRTRGASLDTQFARKTTVKIIPRTLSLSASAILIRCCHRVILSASNVSLLDRLFFVPATSRSFLEG